MSDSPVLATATGRRPAARERVCDYLRGAILRGELEPGAFLEEEAVGRATGVSRTPVREAFHKLEAERYLDLHPRRGARVRQVTAREMLELYETRRLIEGFAVSKLCQEGHPLPPALFELTRAMRTLGDRDLARHVEMDRLLHRSLVAAARNAVLLEAYDRLRARQECVAMTALNADPSRLPTILDEHEAIVAGLEVLDQAAVVAVLARHLQPIGHVIAKLPQGLTR